MQKCDFNTSEWCSPVNLLNIFRTSFPRNTSGWLLLNFLQVLMEYSFWEGEWALVSNSMKFWDFSEITEFSKVLRPRMFGNSWCHSLIQFLLRRITLRFTWGEIKLCKNYQKSSKYFDYDCNWQRLLVYVMNLNYHQAFLFLTSILIIFLKIVSDFTLILWKHQLSACGSIQGYKIHTLSSSSLRSIFH